MPGFDKSGPAGNGPMSGGGRGVCASPEDRADFARCRRERRNRSGRFRGSGTQRGRRFEKGFGDQDYSRSTTQPNGTGEWLETQMNELRDTIDKLQQRVDKLSS